MASVVEPPCKGAPSLFFSDVLAEQEAAKKVCAECPWRAKCLQRSYDLNALDGIWGGYDEVERRFYSRLFGTIIGDVVRPLPKALVAKLRRNKVMQVDEPPDAAMEA